MQQERMTDARKVVYLRPRDARRARWRRLTWSVEDLLEWTGWFVGAVLWWVARTTFLMARMALAAFLVLIEPLVAIVLVPFAFFGTLATLIMGFAMETPWFPKWGMLGLSVGALCLYWLFVALIMIVVGGRGGR